ncbi:Protein N-terminal amidase [Tolypocladium ophioglossoides CBS 100239]|uniref:Protein N-terminal amidase n=1 Tax=Tolypocladium ophioglossoides (strain CBS 100239) TaxID=1163406 RepID=A0A0L0NHR3_TOLOC|nr:Protein N-terminal amidase [Tolypocladium ophioglossoides CBS 100239]
MRIACLQFAPQVGDVDNNLNRADAVLSKANPEDLDLLVLPELAFSGYNFKSLQDITPFLEPSGSGITSLWARTIALRLNCNVTVGYPEKVDVSPKWPTGPEYYNSAIVVNGDGETIANYRKSFLYYTDESWALEGYRGFFEGYIPGLGNTSIGICMDLNPYKFEAPWHAFEFAFHVLEAESNLVIVSMAWMTREDPRRFSRMPNEPDMDTLTYWVTRLEPLIRSENQDEIIVVFCNRTGTEDEATYAGTSTVIGIHDGEVKVYGLLGRGEKELLVVDTTNPPYAKLVYRPNNGGGIKLSGSLEESAKVLMPDERNNVDNPGEKGPGESKSEDMDTSGDNPSPSGGASGSSKDQMSCGSNSTDPTARGRSPGRKSPPAPPSASSLPPLPKLPDSLTSEVPKRHKAPPITIPSPPDLAVRGSAQPPGTESFNIPTPSAPSPTPMAIRPKLIIPESPSAIPYQYAPEHPSSAASARSEKSIQSVRSNESEASTQTIKSNPRPPEDSTPYPHSGAPPSGYPSNSFCSKKRIYGGHVTISRADDGFNPTTPFDDNPPVSPRWFWRPCDTLLRTPVSGGAWQPGTPIGRKPEPFPWPAIKEVSQEVSRTGEDDRVKNHLTSQETRDYNSQSPQSNTSSNRTKRSRSSAGTAKSACQSEKQLARPPSPKSRNASRSRNHNRSDSALNPCDVTTAITQHLESISQRAESVGKMRGESTNATPVSDRPRPPKSRNRSRGRPSDAEELQIGQQTIHIGASPSILENGGRPSSVIQTPISGTQQRPLSRFNRHQRSNSFTAANSGHLSSSTDHSCAPWMITNARPASRAASRGRQPAPKVSLTKSDPTGSHSHRAPSVDSVSAEAFYSQFRCCPSRESEHGSGRRPSDGNGSRSGRHHSHSREMIEFVKFEAIVCPNCPVHGRRRSDPSTNGESSSASPEVLSQLDGTRASNAATPMPTSGNQRQGSSTETDRMTLEAAQEPAAKTSRGSGTTEGTAASDRSSSKTISTTGRSPATPPFFSAATPRAMALAPDDIDIESLPGGDLNGDDLSACCTKDEKVQSVELCRSTVT